MDTKIPLNLNVQKPVEQTVHVSFPIYYEQDFSDRGVEHRTRGRIVQNSATNGYTAVSVTIITVENGEARTEIETEELSDLDAYATYIINDGGQYSCTADKFDSYINQAHVMLQHIKDTEIK